MSNIIVCGCSEVQTETEGMVTNFACNIIVMYDLLKLDLVYSSLKSWRSTAFTLQKLVI